MNYSNLSPQYPTIPSKNASEKALLPLAIPAVFLSVLLPFISIGASSAPDIAQAKSAPISETTPTYTSDKLDCDKPQNNTFVKSMLNLINEDRQKNSLQKLSWSPKLCLSAQLKSLDMAINNYFEHTAPDGTSPWKNIKLTGYQYISLGENLSLNYLTPQKTHSALMNSIGHRKNILRNNFSQIGISYLETTINNKPAFVVIEHFGQPLVQK